MKKKVKKPKNSPPVRRNKIPRKASEVLVNQAMLFGVRNELIERIAASEKNLEVKLVDLERRFDSKMEKLGSRIDKLELRIGKLESRMDKLESRMDSLELRMEKLELKLEAGFHEMNRKIDRMTVLIEEQNARNKTVLDAILSIMERQRRSHRVTQSREFP